MHYSISLKKKLYHPTLLPNCALEATNVAAQHAHFPPSKNKMKINKIITANENLWKNLGPKILNFFITFWYMICLILSSNAHFVLDIFSKLKVIMNKMLILKNVTNIQ